MRSLVPIACNQFATLVLGIAGLKLIDRYVEPAVYGPYALFLTLTQLGVQVTHSGVINHATRYWQREKIQAGAYARFLWLVSWRQLLYLAPLLVVISVAVGFREGEAVWIWILPWLILSNIAMALQGTATGALNAEGKLWRVFWISAAGAAARVLFPIGLGVAAGVTFSNLSCGFALHGLLMIGGVSLVFGWIGQSPVARPEVRFQWRQELKTYGRPFIWMGVGGWLLLSADRWIAQQFYGEAQAGLFAYASNIGAIVPALVMGGLMQLVFPAVFRKADRAQTRHDWKALARHSDRVTGVFLGLSIGGLALLSVIGPSLEGRLISAKYHEALRMLFPAGLAMVTVQVNQFYFLLLQGQHNSAGMVKVMIVVAGVKTAGSILAASISWPVFLWWLASSLFVCGLMGRTMIRRMALQGEFSEAKPSNRSSL